jgi:hypothetical protein
VRSTAAELLTDLSKKIDGNSMCCEFTGSVDNQNVVYNAILNKYGEEEANKYKPTINVRTKEEWIRNNYVIKENEIALCFVHIDRGGRKSTVALYHEKQVIPLR